MAICRNFSFWNYGWNGDQTGWFNCSNGGGRLCHGNFPSFCSSAESSLPFVKQRDPTFEEFKCLEDYVPAHRRFSLRSSLCPDGADLAFCASSVNCDEYGLFRCADNLTCIEENLVCDGYKQCLDGSDENEVVSFYLLLLITLFSRRKCAAIATDADTSH